MVHIDDKGNQPCRVTVNVQGAPAKSIIDSGADITIINGDVFKKIAAVSHLKKKAFKAADKSPVGYDNQPFKLDGSLDLRITFSDCTLHTTMYLKMDQDPLLLSEVACHQLGIISYHPDVGMHPLQDSVSYSSPCGESQAGKICTAVAALKQDNTCTN